MAGDKMISESSQPNELVPDHTEQEASSIRHGVATQRRLEQALDIALQRNTDLELRIRQLGSELDSVNEQMREGQTNIDALEREILQLRSDFRAADDRLKETRARADRIAGSKERHIAALEQRVSSTKASPTYQLGHAIIAATKSWSGLIALPRSFLAVHTEGRRRRKIRENKKLS